MATLKYEDQEELRQLLTRFFTSKGYSTTSDSIEAMITAYNTSVTTPQKIIFGRIIPQTHTQTVKRLKTDFLLKQLGMAIEVYNLTYDQLLTTIDPDSQIRLKHGLESKQEEIKRLQQELVNDLGALHILDDTLLETNLDLVLRAPRNQVNNLDEINAYDAVERWNLTIKKLHAAANQHATSLDAAAKTTLLLNLRRYENKLQDISLELAKLGVVS